MFGPFDNLQGKYGPLSREDLMAEMSKLWEFGLVEKVTDGEGAGRYRWTNFGCTVIGKLGQE